MLTLDKNDRLGNPGCVDCFPDSENSRGGGIPSDALFQRLINHEFSKIGVNGLKIPRFGIHSQVSGRFFRGRGWEMMVLMDSCFA